MIGLNLTTINNGTLMFKNQFILFKMGEKHAGGKHPLASGRYCYYHQQIFISF